MLDSSLRRRALAAGACAVTALLALASAAYATHARPKGATPLFTAFVVAYQPCGAASNANHGPQFSFPSCNPPVPSSQWLTVGTPDWNAQPADFTGSSKLSVIPGDIKADVNLSGVRCTNALAGLTPALCPSGGNHEYLGKVAAVYDLRITDHCNTPVPQAPPPVCPVPPAVGPPFAATVRDFPFAIIVPCVPNAPPPSASDCNLSTTFDAITGGPPFGINANTRANIKMGDPRVMDGGPDGDPTTNNVDRPDQRYLEEGVFVP